MNYRLQLRLIALFLSCRNTEAFHAALPYIIPEIKAYWCARALGYSGGSIFERAISPMLDFGIFANYLSQSRTSQEFCDRSVELAFHGLSVGAAITRTGDIGAIPATTAGALLAGQLISEKVLKINTELATQKAMGEIIIKNPVTRSVFEAFIAAHTLGLQYAIPFSFFKRWYHIETLVMSAITIPICFYQFFRERTKFYTGERFFSKRRPQISKTEYYKLESIDVDYMEVYENINLSLPVGDSKGFNKTD